MEVKSKQQKANIRKVIKDDDGYYKVKFGKFNTFNKSGKYYRVRDVNKFLGPNSLVGKRIDQGLLIGEDNHPDVSMLDNTGLQKRTIYLDKKNASIHIKSIEVVDTNKTEPGFDLNIIEVFGWVKPIGETKQVLIDLLDNVGSNVAFSVRSLVTETRVGSIIVRDVLAVSTWDTVASNGVAGSTQWATVGMESGSFALLENINELHTIKAAFESDGALTCESGKCVLSAIDAIMTDNDVDFLMNW